VNPPGRGVTGEAKKNATKKRNSRKGRVGFCNKTGQKLVRDKATGNCLNKGTRLQGLATNAKDSLKTNESW